MSDVRVEVFQNEYLPENGTVVDAVVSVTSGTEVGVRPAASARAAEIIMIDCSGSMEGERIRAARDAACVAIDTLRDGVEFAVIAGTDRARKVFPLTRALVPASMRSRLAAKTAVKMLRSDGGTLFSTWLRLANTLFAGSKAEIKHAILLTDGANGDGPQEFQAALDSCVGRFVCDSRGVGSGWFARDLLAVAEALLGSADGMKDPAQLEADFRSMVETAMGKTLAGVALRLWTPAGARIRFVKQVFPDILDLTARRTDVSPRIGEYPVGAWGAESRDYHLCVELDPRAVGDEMLAARVSVVHEDNVLAQGLVRALWTDDTAYSTKINKRVAHYTGQAELAAAIQDGLAARAAGDLDRATDRLGRAVQLATESGRDDTAKLLDSVVEIVDAPTGTVRMRSRGENASIDIDAEIAAVTSRRTSRVRPEPAE